ncbi:superoxide dismutase family protein [Actinomadura hibisca]|uniref:superoxide dismutase family protein n=1 Tax=Actinomadura hibisca TaxID=68565 RepID=UPI0008304AF7|nr:superoxide dismutase family protein [Actinomadura hibisca]
MPLLRRTTITLTAAGAAVSLLSPPALAHARPHVVEATGPTNVYNGAYAKAVTKVRVTTRKKRTTVRFAVSGFPDAAAGRRFGVHVHQNACGPKPADAGGHYQNPDARPDAPPRAKEVWLDVRVDRDGKGRARMVVPWRIAKGDAGSVVVHTRATDHHTGDAGDRLLCTTVPFGD